MIPVTLQPKPADFDANVKLVGNAWLASNGIALTGPLPKAKKIPALWSSYNKILWTSYGGTCAYLAIYFEWVTGASSTDHFVAKSKNAGQVYEWDNYRLSCLGPNRNKNKFDDVLDPIGLTVDTFELNLASGEISPRKTMGKIQIALAKKTIRRLKLDSADHNLMRSRHFNQYLRHQDSQTLKDLSPFVWYEADRQGLL